MARAKATLADVQQDQELFDAYCTEIQTLGVDAVLEKGGVSRTTLYDYMRHKPVDQKTEDVIIRNVIACRDDRSKERKKRQDFARQGLATN